MKIEVSDGEIVDKLTILAIKKKYNTDPNKSKNINSEFDHLESMIPIINPPKELLKDLYNVNLMLWDVEDELRVLESEQRFDEHFIELARKVYKLNDERARIKYAINVATKSKFVEEKILPEYGEK